MTTNVTSLERRVLCALGEFGPAGASLHQLCESCCLWVADVAATLDALTLRGWVCQDAGRYLLVTMNIPMSVDQAINSHLARLGSNRDDI